MARGVARDVGEVAETLGVDDLMVFEMTDARARLRGGHGRGAGWAGVVELDVAEEPLLSSTTDLGRAVRIDQAEPVR
ncbi:MAG: hypothetical protein IT341_05550, partial [Chloroflexi bacterium]|nr:hypothetical protein [Chloroflexota bacterium]